VRPPEEQVAFASPVPSGTADPEAVDWNAFATRRIAEHAAAGDRSALLRFVHELEFELPHGHDDGGSGGAMARWIAPYVQVSNPPAVLRANPWRVIEHLADRLAAALKLADPEPSDDDPAGAAAVPREASAA
jgi:hypothetical protein